MKKPMKKIKPRRFAEGGNTFSPEQEKFLGGADRTDPYILARMRKAVPDQAPVEDRIPTPVNQIKDEDSFERVIKNAAVNDDGQVMEAANKGEDLATSLRGENILKRMRDADSAPPVKKQAAPTAGSRGSVKPPSSNEGKNEIKPALKSGKDGPTADELDRYAADQRAKREAASKKGTDAAATSEAKADNIPIGQNTKTVEGESTDSMSDTERNLLNILYATGVGGGIAGAALKFKRMLAAAKSIKGQRAIEAANAIKGRGDGFVMYKKGGQVKKMAAGGSVSSRGDGIAQRGKTRGKMC